MLVLRACFGVKPVIMQESSINCVVVDAFAKLSGKYLGKIVLPTKINSMFDAIRELQRQGAKLLPHSERPCQYLAIQLDQVELPCLTYNKKGDDVPNVEQALAFLAKATSKSRVDLVWKEDDSIAWRLISFMVRVDNTRLMLYNSSFPNELGVLAFTHRPTEIYLKRFAGTRRDGCPTTLTCLGFLAHMKHLQKLELANIDVESWDFAKTTTIKTLDLTDTSIDNADLQKFRHLEFVVIRGLSKSNFTTLEFAKMPCLTKVVVWMQFVEDLELCARYLFLKGFNTQKEGRWLGARRTL
jgi:hypothetical protein